MDSQGQLSTATTATEAITVNPVAPTLAPVAETGVEGSPIALNLGASAKNLAGDSNSLATLTISAIPVGATLSDGVNTFTATTGNTSVSVLGWSLSSLTITPVNDANFSLSVSATQMDSQGQLSTATTATEAITVNPVAPTLAPVAETGVEGSPIALNLGASAKNLAGDSNSLATLTISAIPVGATLSDGVNTFTATTGNTSVSVLGWSLSSLTITPVNDANFSLSVSATQMDSQGQLSTATTATEAITVNPVAPTLAPVAETGVEGSPIALNLGASAKNLAGDSNSLATLTISAIPVGATLSDGVNTFTATTGNTSVSVLGWSLSSLTITPVNDANFSLSVSATQMDSQGQLSTATTATEAITVNPVAPTLAPVAETGVEGSPIALNLGASAKNLAGDSNSLATLTISAIPVGATLSDGVNTFTATTGNTSVSVLGWSLSSLTITPVNDANFSLSVSATQMDSQGQLSTATTATEAITVNPVAPTLAPVAETGVEGSPIALNLGASAKNLAGDSNSLATLTISAIPVGATLSDGVNTFTATTGNTSVSVLGWSLSSLTITPVNDANFSLSVSATQMDSQGQLSTATTATEAITVNPVAPTLAPVAETGVEGSPIALNLGASAKNLAGDSNSLATLTISAIPVGATLSDGVNTFTATTGNTSVSVLGWSLSSLTITPVNDANFSLSVSATQMDSQGQLSTATTATEAITVNPVAPTLAPVAETGVEGSPIALNLGASAKNLAGDSNSLATLTISAIPVGATLSDGVNTFTATTGNTSVSVLGWSLSSLTITPVNDANFSLSVSATQMDSQGQLSTATTATEAITVNPVAPTLAPVAETGVEGSPIALNLGASAKNLAGDSNSLATLTISAIPVGATLSDGVNTFTATTGNTSVSVLGWSLSSLTITPVNDANFSLSVSATQMDSQGQLSTATTATEAITVNPVAPTLAPVAETGVEGSPIALNLGASAKNLAGDSNSLATLTISAIPVGATLSDGVNTFTATTGNTSVSVLGWSLSSLTITPVNDANFSLSVSATQMDSQGQLSTATTATEAITVNPPPPPSLTVIESSGSMSLLTDGTNYFLQPNGGAAVELSYNGAPVFAGEFAQYGYNAPIAAAQTANGYEVAWKTTSGGQYQVWLTDSNGNETSIPFVGSGAQVESYETSFNNDLNGDGTLGVSPLSPPQFVYQGTDATGAQVYDITNASGLEPFAVRVLTPEHPSTVYPHSFLYDLQVEPGLAQSTWGSGLNELENLDVEDQYNATIIEPIFPMDSCYADNPNNPTIDYETFVADILPQWVDSNFSTTGTEQNLLVGFSKSGYGGLDLELKHPSVFSAVAAFDFPGDMTSYDAYGSSSANDYGTQANFQDNYEMNASFIEAHATPFTSQDRILISEGPIFQSQVADFDTLLTSQGIMHTTLNQTTETLRWYGGWLSGEIARPCVNVSTASLSSQTEICA
jgi:hypothetical protein